MESEWMCVMVRSTRWKIPQGQAPSEKCDIRDRPNHGMWQSTHWLMNTPLNCHKWNDRPFPWYEKKRWAKRCSLDRVKHFFSISTDRQTSLKGVPSDKDHLCSTVSHTRLKIKVGIDGSVKNLFTEQKVLYTGKRFFMLLEYSPLCEKVLRGTKLGSGGPAEFSSNLLQVSSQPSKALIRWFRSV